MKNSIFFKSEDHKKRFKEAMERTGKTSGGFDPSHSAALYILTADTDTWDKTQGYMDGLAIDIPTMLDEVDFSGGYSVIIQLAGNLFNGLIPLSPVELIRLDETNFRVAMCAIELRHYGLRVADLKDF